MRKAAFLSLCLSLMLLATLSNVSLAQDRLNFALDECVDMTLKNNEGILKARQAVAEAEGSLMTVRSDEYLQVNFTSWYQRSKQDNNFTTKDYNGTLSAEQLLLRFGELPARLDAAQEQYRKANLELQAAKINAVSQTRRIFYDIILIQNEMEQRKELRDEIDKKLIRTKERVTQRLALELEQLAVEQELAEQELSINELKRRLRVRKLELLQTIGADEEAEAVISGEMPDVEFIIENSIKAAMANHVDLKDLRGQIERQERIVREVLWELLPEFRTAYRYKDTSLVLDQENRTWDTSLVYEKPIWEKEGEMTPKRDKWEFSLSLGFPIFDGYRVKGIMQMEQARLKRLETELLQREKRIRLEVRQAYHQVADQKENMEIKERVVTLREKTLTRMEAIMETPVISQKYPHLAGITFDDVIRAREQYTDAQRDYFAQRRNYMLAQEDLRQKMGLIE